MFLADAKAFWDGLSLIWNRGFRRVDCEVDCTKVLSAVEDLDSMRFASVLEWYS